MQSSKPYCYPLTMHIDRIPHAKNGEMTGTNQKCHGHQLFSFDLASFLDILALYYPVLSRRPPSSNVLAASCMVHRARGQRIS